MSMYSHFLSILLRCTCTVYTLFKFDKKKGNQSTKPTSAGAIDYPNEKFLTTNSRTIIYLRVGWTDWPAGGELDQALLPAPLPGEVPRCPPRLLGLGCRAWPLPFQPLFLQRRRRKVVREAKPVPGCFSGTIPRLPGDSAAMAAPDAMGNWFDPGWLARGLVVAFANLALCPPRVASPPGRAGLETCPVWSWFWYAN